MHKVIGGNYKTHQITNSEFEQAIITGVASNETAENGAPKPQIPAEQLFKAVEEGNLASVKDLISQGVDVNSQNDSGATALMFAVIDGRVDIVTTLLKNGANPNIKTNAGKTAFVLADENYYLNIAEILKKFGAVGKLTAPGGIGCGRFNKSRLMSYRARINKYDRNADTLDYSPTEIITMQTSVGPILVRPSVSLILPDASSKIDSRVNLRTGSLVH